MLVVIALALAAPAPQSFLNIKATASFDLVNRDGLTMADARKCVVEWINPATVDTKCGPQHKLSGSIHYIADDLKTILVTVFGPNADECISVITSADFPCNGQAFRTPLWESADWNFN